MERLTEGVTKVIVYRWVRANMILNLI
jgi:hypothetical protein